jgi:hypothetical protein
LNDIIADVTLVTSNFLGSYIRQEEQKMSYTNIATVAQLVRNVHQDQQGVAGECFRQQKRSTALKNTIRTAFTFKTSLWTCTMMSRQLT